MSSPSARGEPGSAASLQRDALGDAQQRGDRFRHAVGVDRMTDVRAPRATQLPLVRRAQPMCLVYRRWQVGVVPGRQRAGDRAERLVLDALREVLQHGP